MQSSLKTLLANHINKLWQPLQNIRKPSPKSILLSVTRVASVRPISLELPEPQLTNIADRRWVDRQARKLDARLDKKRKQMERNKKTMGLRKNVLMAEIESLHAKIAQAEIERIIKITEATKQLEEVEERARETKLETTIRLARSRAPSPEPQHSTSNTIRSNRVVPSPLPTEAKHQIPCRAESSQRVRQLCSNTLSTSTANLPERICSKPSYRKIIWKVTYKTDSPRPLPFNTAIQRPNPKPIGEKNNRIGKRQNNINPSSKYISEEYDHSEVFEEPDNPADEDYDPEIED
ncbi:hypothetical protein ONS95_002682 [Cadophora gregata]|uniref:uncharacterized protein n=1 Tax=Cadophora gregata TaxID=51156 RepID=UPI0026DD0B26|nr:uncharacterized protein ONS95_002682 [Cadophora gregata]KAK0110021.1 hypothetical protein ONS95_002682 [Cadophora gregata]KAK0110356.1 hypothetical protein ONS96_001972 [Cadophora gregata f. sp. sojae]